MVRYILQFLDKMGNSPMELHDLNFCLHQSTMCHYWVTCITFGKTGYYLYSNRLHIKQPVKTFWRLHSSTSKNYCRTYSGLQPVIYTTDTGERLGIWSNLSFSEITALHICKISCDISYSELFISWRFTAFHKNIYPYNIYTHQLYVSHYTPKQECTSSKHV